MKILHYIPSIDRASGGVGAYMQLLAKELGKLVELHVLTHSSENQLKLENCSIHYIGTGWLPWSNIKNEFLTLLDCLRPDVFHTNCCWLPISALTSMWAKEAGYPVVYTPHGMLEPWIMSRNYWTKKVPATLLFQKKGVSVANIVHATADNEKDNLLNLKWNDRVDVIPNCVDLDDIDANVKSVHTDVEANTILFLSRIHVKKGINFLIEAASNLKKELSGWKIKIAGEGDVSYIEELKSLSGKLGVNDIVEFVGGVYGQDKWKLFSEASLFVLPTHSENFGIVVAEALACKVPVVTTVGTPWNELRDEKCGWWTEIGTKPIEDAIREFLAMTKEERLLLGINGRQLVEKKYSTVTVAHQFVEMYKKLL